MPIVSSGDAQEREVEGEGGEEGWLDTGDLEAPSDLGDTVGALDLGGGGPAVNGTGCGDGNGSVTTADDDDDDDDDIESIEDFDYNESALADDDDAALPAGGGGVANDNVVKTRTYDLTITYDVHYSTPRVWLFGYDSNHNPLTGDSWQEDFSPEHRHKTVTHEQHPNFPYSCPTIHPCKHAHAMKQMIDRMAVGDEAGVLDVQYYLLIFLKFIQAIIPNIECM